MYIYNYKDWLSYWTKCLKIKCYTAKEILYNKNVSLDCINLILRHDIDSCTSDDIKIISAMAKIQEDFELRGSYYLLNNNSYYKNNKDFFLDLQSRGHEIGLHVDLSYLYQEGKSLNKNKVFSQLSLDVDNMRKDGFNIFTAAWHGSTDNINAKILLSYSENNFISYINSNINKTPLITDCCYFFTTYKDFNIIPKNNNLTLDLDKYKGKVFYSLLHPCSAYYSINEDLSYSIKNHKYWEDNPTISYGYKKPQSLQDLFQEKIEAKYL